MPADPATPAPPLHPLHALATFELTGYRRQLERALACRGAQDPEPAAQGDLQAKLDAVIAEEEDRRRFADA